MRPLRAFAIPVTAVLTLAVAAPAALQAQILDLTGTWNLDLEAVPVEEEVVEEAAARQAGPVLQPKGVELVDPCIYSGTVIASQDGDDWTGPAELGLVSGPAECPAEMIGDLTGTLSEDGGVIFITGFIDGGQLGHAIFDGTISPNPGGSGTMTVNQGDFQDTEGEWVAVLQQSVLEIPELTPVGMAVLTLLLLAAGAWMLSRQTA